MLRIHFSADDMRKTRIASGPDTMWEVLFSLYRLRRPEGMVVFGSWRHAARTRTQPSARLLTDLAPSRGYAVDFLTPACKTGSLEEGVQALRSTPHSRLRTDLAELSARHPYRPLPRWIGSLADGSAVGRVADAVVAYHQACLAPYWPAVQRQVEDDRIKQCRRLAEGGWPRVFAGLHPSARWDYPVLELDYPADRDIFLGGRGLTLQPSFFCWGQPTTLLDGDLPPVLAYPVQHALNWMAVDEGHTRTLEAILGTTRTRLLRTLASGGCNSSVLAALSGVSVSSASRQASLLAETNLIASHREGKQVVHRLTSLGAALLNGSIVHHHADQASDGEASSWRWSG